MTNGDENENQINENESTESTETDALFTNNSEDSGDEDDVTEAVSKYQTRSGRISVRPTAFDDYELDA